MQHRKNTWPLPLPLPPWGKRQFRPQGRDPSRDISLIYFANILDIYPEISAEISSFFSSFCARVKKTPQAGALVLERVRDAGPSWDEIEGPAAAGGAALVAKWGRGCGET